MMPRRHRALNQPINLTEADITILFEGNPLWFNKPICRDGNRYYIPLSEFVSKLNGTVSLSGQQVAISIPERETMFLDLSDSHYKTAYYKHTLYLSLFDLCRLLDLITVWDYDEESIGLYYNAEQISQPKIHQKRRPALIRFEDVTAGNEYLKSGNLERFRVVGDYLYAKGIPFHIAWIPRFIDPSKEIDNDISKNYSMPNADFLFTMEYLLNQGGIIGLHGYTHQHGNEISGDGTEFSEDRNDDKASIKDRVEAAITLANKLSLPYQFFESPHYASTAFQQSVYETYFDIIYEGYVGIWGDRVVRSPRNQKTIYVSTPLGYVEGENGLAKLLERVNNIDDETLASLFYHPYPEFDYITVTTAENGYPTYDYQTNSPLHQITDALLEKDYEFIHVTDLL